MTLEKKSRTGSFIALGCCILLLCAVILLENLGAILGTVPAVLMPTSLLFTVLKKGAVYSLVAVSMNLLNGFTGLFSLGQAGFMLLGAYTYAILSVPVASRDSVYYLYGGSVINFSLQELFGGGLAGLILGCLVAVILGGCVAALFAWLIGLPVLRLKSDYLAIATLGFAEILRAIFQWDKLGPVTNGANMIGSIPTYSSFNVTNEAGQTVLRLSTFVPFLVAMICIGIIVLLINSSYGRAFKAIREDEIAAEAMGINLAKHKMLSFCTSAFFAGVGGALFAMYANNAQAKVYTSAMTYEILLIVVIGGIGSISGSCIATFLYVACSEWWLRFLDTGFAFQSPTDTKRILFIVIFAAVVILLCGNVIRKENKSGQKSWRFGAAWAFGLILLGWLGWFVISGSLQLYPLSLLMRNGFRMVTFSIIIMIVVLFFRQGIMGQKELPDLFKKKGGAAK